MNLRITSLISIGIRPFSELCSAVLLRRGFLRATAVMISILSMTLLVDIPTAFAYNPTEAFLGISFSEYSEYEIVLYAVLIVFVCVALVFPLYYLGHNLRNRLRHSQHRIRLPRIRRRPSVRERLNVITSEHIEILTKLNSISDELSGLNTMSDAINDIRLELSALKQRASVYRIETEKTRTTGSRATSPQPRAARRKPSLEETLEDICNLYNAVVDDRSKQGDFTRRYDPRRIGVANVMDRRRDMDIEPVFKEANDGNYYAVAVEGITNYAVMPRFDLTLQESNYRGPGAIGEVFDCPGYNSQESYRNIKAAKPALFGFDPAKRQWEIREKGELDLGRQAREQVLSLGSDAAKRREELKEKGMLDTGRQARKPASLRPTKGMLEEIRRLYNVAVDDGNRRKEFTQRYEPIRIGVATDSEKDQHRDLTIKPVFRKSEYGDLYALPIEGSRSYTVVPRFALELQESNYESSAIGEVFDCPGYNLQENYSNVKVAKPAIFEFDSAKQQWEIREKGALDLGKETEIAKPPLIAEPALEDIASLYNTTIDNPGRQDGFEQHYKPIRIDIANAADLLQRPDIKPIFQASDDGNYLTVAVEGDTSYAVVPRLALTLYDFVDDPGAIEHVFDCPEYDKRFRIYRLRVVKPALLDPVDAAQQRWELREKGELCLAEWIQPIERPSSEADAAKQRQDVKKTVKPDLGKEQTTQQSRTEPEENIIKLYNAAVEDPRRQDEFMQRFQPTTLGVVTAKKGWFSGSSADTEPTFQTADDGDYYAVGVEGQAGWAFLVPRFGLVIDRPSYESSAIGKVFYCSDYDPNFSYSGVKLIQPALFGPGGKEWEIKNAGMLSLGEGTRTQQASKPSKSKLRKIRHDYNEAVDNRAKQGEFKKDYQPITFGVVNATEREQDPTIKPIFETVKDGNYYAVEVEGSTRYAVVPRFDLEFNESRYGPSAMGDVFDSNYNPRCKYRFVKVSELAFFEPDAAKQRWELKDKGELDLPKGIPLDRES